MTAMSRPTSRQSASFGRDEELRRGLSPRDVLAFGEAWRRGSKSQPLSTYLGGDRASEGSLRSPSQPG